MSINFVVTNYEKKLTEDYSIVIVSQKALDENVVKSKISQINTMSEISSKKILDRLKRDISSTNLALLQVALPKFYSVKLHKLPDEKELEQIQKEFKKIDSITKIETFAKTHTKMYKMFIFVQKLSYVFSTLILIVSVLLMFKQMRIWLLEHQERMSIMTLFGAPFWMKSIFLYKLAIIDSIISTLIVSGLFWYLPKREDFKDFFASLDVVLYEFDILKDTGVLLGFSICFSIIIVSLVISKMKNR
jgi:cell division transport system permease protein